MERIEKVIRNWNTQKTLLKEDVGGAIIGGGIGAGVGGLHWAFQEWMMKYIKECKEAILTANTPEEAIAKIGQIAKTDDIISRRYFVANYLEDKLRLIAATSKDNPDWKDQMYKKVNSVIRNTRFASALLMTFTTLYGAGVGAAV